MDYGRLLESKGHWFRSNLEFHKAFRPNHVIRIVVTCEIKNQQLDQSCYKKMVKIIIIYKVLYALSKIESQVLLYANPM